MDVRLRQDYVALLCAQVSRAGAVITELSPVMTTHHRDRIVTNPDSGGCSSRWRVGEF
jgi:hypothetical protein